MLQLQLPPGVKRTYNDSGPAVELLADNYEALQALIQVLPDSYSYSTGQRYAGPGSSNIYVTVCAVTLVSGGS